MIYAFLRELGDYFEAGGWVMPPLAVATVVLWFAIGYRFASLRRGTKRGARNLMYRAVEGKMPSGNGVMVRAALKGLKIKQSRRTDIRPYLDAAFAEDEQEIRKFNTLVTTIVLVAPLLGLLGTVIGMIETFDSLGDMSLFSQSGGIAGGISQALFTTQMGLAVSIPGLVVNSMLNRRSRDIAIELAQIKDILCTRELDRAIRNQTCETQPGDIRLTEQPA